jgi:hypothetical protein
MQNPKFHSIIQETKFRVDKIVLETESRRQPADDTFKMIDPNSLES